jgi:hypothetical protein
MIELMMYLPTDIANAMTQLRLSCEAGAIDAHEYHTRLSHLQFRDVTGDYWAVDGRTGRWYHFVRQQWHPADLIPDRLEGPIEFARYRVARSDERGPGAQPINPYPDHRHWPPQRVLTELIEYVAALYQQGQLSSADAEALLRSRFLIDTQGRFWMPGLRSRQWYWFEAGRWTPAAQAPDPASLLRYEPRPTACPQCGQALTIEDRCPRCQSPIERHVAGGSAETVVALFNLAAFGDGSLPEPITDEWNPPSWSLAAVEAPAASVPAAKSAADLICPRCGTHAAPGRRFCTRCGAALSMMTGGPQ